MLLLLVEGLQEGKPLENYLKKEKKVLLVEKHSSFALNNFSSAGMTLAPIKEFNLPNSVIGAYWKDLVIQCSSNCYSWTGSNKKGVVLDFKNLREFLAEETRQFGGEVLMGYKYVSKRYKDSVVYAKFIHSKTSKEVEYQSNILVDATGPLRKVMYNTNEKQPEMILGSGTEYEIEVSQEIYDQYKEKLLFF